MLTRIVSGGVYDMAHSWLLQAYNLAYVSKLILSQLPLTEARVYLSLVFRARGAADSPGISSVRDCIGYYMEYTAEGAWQVLAMSRGEAGCAL